MTTLIAFVADISFFEVGLSLIALCLVEQIYVRLPDDMAGLGRWRNDRRGRS